MKMKTIFIFTLLLFQFNVFSQSVETETYKRAYVLFQKAQYSEAINVIDNINTITDLNEQFNYLKGDCYFQLKDYENAVHYFMLSYGLKNKYALYRTAESYALKGDAVKACEYLKVYLEYKDKLLRSEIISNKNFKGIENTKSWKQFWKNDFYNTYLNKLDEAKFNISLNKHAEAFYILDNLIISNKNRYRAYEMRGDLYMKIEDYKKAVSDYSEAVKLRNKTATYRIKEADALLKLSKYKKAAEKYQIIALNYPHRIDIFLNKAKAEFLSNEYDTCKNSLSEYLKYFPENAEANFLEAKIYEYENDLVNSLIYHNKSIENDDTQKEYFISRGDVYFKTKMYENAVNDYSMALDLDPRSGEVYYKRGVAKLNFDKESACKDFQKALNLNYYKANDYILKYCR